MASLRSSSSMDRLLEPVSESRPSGENLEYQPEFVELEWAARGTPARQMGTAVAPGEAPNFARVIELARELLQRSKDLRIALQLARALLETQGFAGLADGLRLARGLLEQYWDDLHPAIDPEDPDAMMRRSALSALSSPEWIAAVRAAPLIESTRFGAISLRDIALASGELTQPARHPELDAESILSLFQAASPAVLQTLLDRVEAARSHLKAIDAVWAAGPGSSVRDFLQLERVLHQASEFVLPFLQRSREAAGQGAAAGAEHSRPAPTDLQACSFPDREASAQGAIRGREDVSYWLERICEYYARHEPSSPLPLILQRCRRLVTSSFLEIIRELAPDALSQIHALRGDPAPHTRGDEA